MPIPMSEFPPRERPLLRALMPWQKIVLAILDKARGPMTRSMIHAVALRYGLANQHVTNIIQALGPSDPVKRAAFDSKRGKPSLFTLGYTEEQEYDVDGVIELGVKITPSGRAMLGVIQDYIRNKGLESILPEMPDQADTEMTDAPNARAVHG